MRAAWVNSGKPSIGRPPRTPVKLDEAQLREVEAFLEAIDGHDDQNVSVALSA